GSGSVTGFTIVDPGAGYVSSPDLHITLPGVQATVLPVMAGDRVASFQIVNPGANYAVPPILTITSPYPFTLEGQEVAYFQTGFDNVIIGRADGKHTFHAAQATSFSDAVTLRSPAKGGGF